MKKLTLHNNGQLCIRKNFQMGQNVFVTTGATDVLILLIQKKKPT